MEVSFFNYVESELRKVSGHNFRILAREPVGGGCISRSAKLKTTHGHFFLKWNPSAPPDLFLREAEGLAELQAAAPITLVIPGVILATEADTYPGFLVMEYLEPGSSPQQEEKLGEGLAALHQHRDHPFGFFHDNYCGATPQRNEWRSNWVDFFIENRLLFLLGLIRSHRRFDETGMKIFDRLIKRLPHWLPASSHSSLVHGDLWSGNYLYTKRGPALIDPAAYFGHREMELAIMTLFGGFSSRTWNAYQAAFPLDPGWQERVRMYQLYHLLNHYYLFGGSYWQQSVSLAKIVAG
ncbi:MAG: fructosamine kinase family protein [Mangrovibacterium sp.]|nr:fructosamine kinase family protein [Mangrovibacterium sp.]